MADIDIYYPKILSEFSTGIFCRNLVKRSHENGVQEQKLLRTNGYGTLTHGSYAH
jgi:hypothetical protein